MQEQHSSIAVKSADGDRGRLHGVPVRSGEALRNLRHVGVDILQRRPAKWRPLTLAVAFARAHNLSPILLQHLLGCGRATASTLALAVVAPVLENVHGGDGLD